MPRGRPRLTLDTVTDRIQAYCVRYGVVPTPEGIPPFPAGKRETAQHRQWIALYNAHKRVQRRERGQCERCDGQAVPGTSFCESHQPHGQAASETVADEVPESERRARLREQRGHCPICAKKLPLPNSVSYMEDGALRGILHDECAQVARMARALGQEAVSRLQSFLWP